MNARASGEPLNPPAAHLSTHYLRIQQHILRITTAILPLCSSSSLLTSYTLASALRIPSRSKPLAPLNLTLVSTSQQFRSFLHFLTFPHTSARFTSLALRFTARSGPPWTLLLPIHRCVDASGALCLSLTRLPPFPADFVIPTLNLSFDGLSMNNTYYNTI